MKNLFISRLILLVLLNVFASTITSAKEKPVKGPAIKGYGPAFPIKNRGRKLTTDRHYKVVFDILNSPQDPENMNTRLESIARLINMLVMNGVPAEKITIAAVFHGKAVTNLFNNDAYQKFYHQENPNIQLVKKLKDFGVTFYVCGQSIAFPGFKKSDLIEPDALALSAMTTFIELQQQGYQLLPDY